MKNQILEVVNANVDGLTALGVCFRLGFGGSNKEVYQLIDDLFAEGTINKCAAWNDTVYYPIS